MPRQKALDAAVLEAALEGLQNRLAEVDRNIAEVKRRIGGAKAPAAAVAKAPRRTLSAAARKRISEAQKRRWAQSRAGKKARPEKRAAGAESKAE